MRTKNRIAALSAIVALSTAAGGGSASAAGWPSNVTSVEAKAGQPVTVKGKLDTGAVVNLDWASKSSTACFPATENVNFSGKHVLFGTSIPRQSEMVITAIPDDPTLDISLYAYEIGATDVSRLPPAVPSAVSCEAGYDAKNDSNPGKAESVKLNATTNPYNVVIGVAGAKGAVAGGFTLKVELKTAAGAVQSAVLTPIAIPASSGGIVEIGGSLATGGIIDLGFAAKSSVACFPATENVNFAGNHVVYSTSLPKQSEMTITAVPKDPKLDLSVYAYTVSTKDTTSVPPNVQRVVSCEAGYDAKHDANPGQAETVKLSAVGNPYAVYIGVAGAQGVKAGDYTLKIDVHPRK